VVSFFKHREKSLAIMHCVGEYPSPDDHLHLSQISLLKERYPELEVATRRTNDRITLRR